MAAKDESEGLRATNLAVILEPEGITLDASGRVTLKDPKVLQAILSATTELGAESANDTNYVLCGGNAYQCGKERLAAGTDVVR